MSNTEERNEEATSRKRRRAPALELRDQFMRAVGLRAHWLQSSSGCANMGIAFRNPCRPMAPEVLSCGCRRAALVRAWSLRTAAAVGAGLEPQLWQELCAPGSCAHQCRAICAGPTHAALVRDVWQWKMPKMRNSNYTISNHDRTTYIAEIKEVLTGYGDDLIARFRDSCFGKLLQIPSKVDRCNKAVHHFLTREILKDGGDQTELWFQIGKKRLRFSWYEYALICGLNFGPSNFDPHKAPKVRSSHFYGRVLRKKPITPGALRKKFNEKRGLGDDSNDYLKAAKVLFVSGVLLGMDSGNYIPDWLWVLVEDEEKWESFPWGSYSYQRLLHYLNNIPTARKEDAAGQNQNRVHSSSSQHAPPGKDSHPPLNEFIFVFCYV
ncbi:hypothetical protein C2S51_017354 [Perilla frutescens var. frutescens]|nr:hypothetical protein C2S51_017354 [Perilla frutescens var. frutescens]